MSRLNGTHPLQAPAVDCLFVQMAEGKDTGTPAQPEWYPPGWTDPPADLEKNPELREALQWLQGERRRLEEYTRNQFAALQQRHQAILAQHFRNEETLALRTQELNREMAFFAAQAKIIQERAGELARREKAVAEQAEKLRAQQELQGLGEHTGPNPADWQAETEATSNGLAEAASALEEHQAAWEAKQAEITDRLAQMERRYQALEQAEEAARRRMAELDELENRLTQEFERQERQLALERRQVEALRARLRLQGVDPDAQAVGA
jgi:hypothetical protein